MKIISKYKDYYDYLIGIYGVDPKLVLDRRKHVNPQILGPQRIIIYICGNKIEGFYDGNSFYYGKDLEIIGERKKNRSYNFIWSNRTSKEMIEIKFRPNDFSPKETILINPNIIKTNINDKEDCPIIYGGYHHYKDIGNGNYPKLSDLNISSVYPPEEIYQMLSQWLSERISKKENITDIRCDVDKLQSKGFDKKKSFRNM